MYITACLFYGQFCRSGRIYICAYHFLISPCIKELILTGSRGFKFCKVYFQKMLNGLKLFLKTVLDENKGTFILLTIHFFPEYFVKKFNFFFGNIIKKTILSENSLIKFKFLKNLDLTPFMIAFYRSFKLQFIKNIKIYENISIRTFSFSQNTNFFHQLIQILALII